MIAATKPDNENERLKNLDSYAILDTLPEVEYDDLTLIASQICETPISLISLVDEKRQWFKSHHGLGASETPRELAFCAHAITKPEDILIVPDAREDNRFHDNPLVTENPHVIFYTGVPLISSEGYPLGTLCVIDNKPKSLNQAQITALKSLSNQVVRLLQLRKSAYQLKQLNQKLEIKNKELEQFACVAAHDIKSPLNSLSGVADLLLNNHSDNLNDEGKMLLELIDKSAIQLKELVNGILNYSKSDKWLTEGNETVHLLPMLKNITRLLDAKNEYSFIYPKEDEKLFINPIALEQIFINLISNGIKYNDKPNVIIEIGFAISNDSYNFFVKDNGPGIPERNQEKIFKIFEVLHGHDRDGNRGSGVGLATVKKLVEGLGGSVNLTSTINEGTSFSFSLEKTYQPKVIEVQA